MELNDKADIRCEDCIGLLIQDNETTTIVVVTI